MGKTQAGHKDVTIVMGLIGHDVHAVANRIIEVTLRERGFNVINLRTDNTVDDFIDAVVETNASAILMSSLNGEAENWCKGIRKKLAQVGFGHILIHIGGNLVVGEKNEADVITLFESYGFNRVFYGPTNISHAIDLLEEDLQNG